MSVFVAGLIHQTITPSAMPETLTLELPDDLRDRLQERADHHEQSLHCEILQLLERATDREALWEEIREHRSQMPQISWGPEELKKKMREGLA